MSIKPRRKESEIIEILFSNRKIDELGDFLDQHPDLDIIGLADNQENTILHQLAYEGHLDIIRLFVKEARERLARKLKTQKRQIYQKDQDLQIKKWMDRQNNEGFTALLYASYSGHLDVIEYLVLQHQANYQLTTKSGLNPIHLAAQRNMLLPVVYFRQKIDINSRDQLNSTALHWAGYTNSEQIVAFLLSESSLACLDCQDNDGNTALMLSVLYGNTRVVRRLLIKGADRYIKNKQNKTPLDVAKENNFRTIGRMLNEEFSCLDFLKLYCNVKIEYKPIGRKMTYPILFLTSFILNVGLLNVLVKFVNQWYSLYVQIFILAIAFLLYLSLLRGPSSRQTLDYDEVIKEKNEKNLKKMCFECRNFIPRRGYHCDICKVCVTQYDHHCTWINNCVGKKNIGRFNLFLFFLILSLGLIGLLSVLCEICIFTDNPYKYSEWFQFRFEYQNDIERVLLGVLFGINIIASLFIVPVMLLFIHQITNLLRNKTTYQRMRKPESESGEIKQKMRKYNSKMSLRNCRVMCSGTKSSITSLNTNNQDADIIRPLKASPKKDQKL